MPFLESRHFLSHNLGIQMSTFPFSQFKHLGDEEKKSHGVFLPL